MRVSVESHIRAFIQACLESWNIRARKVFRQPSHFMGKETESEIQLFAHLLQSDIKGKQTLAKGVDVGRDGVMESCWAGQANKYDS